MKSQTTGSSGGTSVIEEIALEDHALRDEVSQRTVAPALPAASSAPPVPAATAASSASAAPSEWTEEVRRVGSDERDRFVMAHAPLVRCIAQRLLARLPASLELSDLVNDGVVGLIEAIDRFDPSRGVRFPSFAESRVRGAILDALRARDVASRSLRRRLREMEAATQTAEQRLGRAPGDDEVAREMGVPANEVATLRRKRESARPIANDPRMSETFVEAGLYSKLPGPFEQLYEAEIQERLAALIEELPPRDRMILALYYNEGLTMKEIGAVLEITESRICQIHTRIVRELKGGLEPAVRLGRSC